MGKGGGVGKREEKSLRKPDLLATRESVVGGKSKAGHPEKAGKKASGELKQPKTNRNGFS